MAKYSIMPTEILGFLLWNYERLIKLSAFLIFLQQIAIFIIKIIFQLFNFGASLKPRS